MSKKLAVLGCGVVGSGVVELFEKNKDLIQKRSGMELEMAYILDLRDFPDKPYANKIVKDLQMILDDPEVAVVAECMGGVEPAFTFVKSCLEAGKSVATSNKELVASKGDILLQTAKEHHCNFFFEASVGGAIPIIRPLHKCLIANEFSAVAGILNGTTNFILNKMITADMDFSSALKLAQEKGYAEKDPTADVDGHDACRKICILSSLAFGKHVYPESVPTKGIREVELKDTKFCGQLGYAIKLIARVQMLENGKILPTVMPMAVEEDNLLSQVNGVYNAVMVRGDGIGKAMFYGRGAGKFPTASAVLGDMIEEVQLSDTIPSQTWENVNSTDFIEDFAKFTAKYYFRTSAADIAVLSEIFGTIEEKTISTDEDELIFVTGNVLNRTELEIAMKFLAQKGIQVLAQYPVLTA
ncbi:MAG: homoserine dehydrogenase [Oscillospiraceae bacterium]|nr:homoserine dehydrogenase [Oscillospiraceae bacterium]